MFPCRDERLRPQRCYQKDGLLLDERWNEPALHEIRGAIKELVELGTLHAVIVAFRRGQTPLHELATWNGNPYSSAFSIAKEISKKDLNNRGSIVLLDVVSKLVRRLLTYHLSAVAEQRGSLTGPVAV